MARSAAALAPLLVGLLLEGCFSPSYGDTPFVCTADYAFACPDGYTCARGNALQGLCVRNGSAVPGGTDAGSGPPDAAVPPDAPVLPGEDASPAQSDAAAPTDAAAPPDAAPHPDAAVCQGAQVVISQVYGAGGNSGATYQYDYVELFNRGATAVDLGTWSVQYASASGSTWSVTHLSGAVAPGGYFLVQEASTNGCSSSPCGAALPSPDLVTTSSDSRSLSATSGKLALVRSQTALTGCPGASQVEDLVGYGTVDCFEGAAAAPALDATHAAVRGASGCADSGDNGADFTAAAPAPRSGAAAAHVCTGC
jgi:hypothetical protein